uniref:Uncharacterized protein n=1 Tax=Mycena chlorophos TaxID=658473 RepID=A0ABQ0LPL0_MYCCL|nr:predicted protein [Mycena chlorophos]
MFSYCHELVTGLVSSARGRRPGPNSDELKQQRALYRHQLYHLEDLAAAPDLNDEERAKLEEQCAQTRDQLEMIRRRYTLRRRGIKRSAPGSELGPTKTRLFEKVDRFVYYAAIP